MPSEKPHKNLLLGGAIAVVLLIAYALTMPRTITLEDAGLFQMVCHLGGISHPPGYPLFTSICQQLVPLFPPGVIAANSLSAIYAALAAAVFFSCVLQLTGSRFTAATAALAYGFSATFWSQAIIVEVYTLAVLGFVVCWRLLLGYVATGKVTLLYLTAFAFGLSLANHWPLMLVSTPALLVTLLPRLSDIVYLLRELRVWLLLALALALGLMPYATILLQVDPEIALLGEVNSLNKLADYVSRSAYGDHHLAASSLDRVYFAGWLLKESVLQLGLVASIVMLLGLVIHLRTGAAHMIATLALMYLGSTLFLNLLLGFSFEFLWQAVFRPYPVISYLALAFWFGLGSTWLTAWLKARLPGREPLAGLLTPVLLVSIALQGYRLNDRSDTRWVENYGRSLLNALPVNAVYFAADDLEVGVLGYLQKVQGIRPDIELRNWENLVFSNRLASPFATAEVQQTAMANYMASNQQPVFASSLIIAPREYRGGFFRYTPAAATTAIINPAMHAVQDQLLDLWESGNIRDLHERHYLYLRLVSFTRQYVHLVLAGASMTEADYVRLERLQNTFPGRLTTLEVLLPLNKPASKPVLMEIALSAQAQIPAETPRASKALLFEYLGRLEMMAPMNVEAAIGYFEASIHFNPVPQNTSLCPLRYLYRQHDRSSDLAQLESRYTNITCGG